MALKRVTQAVQWQHFDGPAKAQDEHSLRNLRSNLIPNRLSGWSLHMGSSGWPQERRASWYDMKYRTGESTLEPECTCQANLEICLYAIYIYIYITVYTFMSVLNTVLQNFRDKNEVKTLDQQRAWIFIELWRLVVLRVGQRSNGDEISHAAYSLPQNVKTL